MLFVSEHGATVLFVSHCGMNGVMESLYHKVPLLCMPIFADQPDNAARLVERGLGLALDRYNINHHLVTEAITEILQNKRYASQLSSPRDLTTCYSYQSQVNRYSAMWRSDERSGFQEAIYWIELLIKYGDFDHLQINDGHLSLLQYFSVDVIAFYLLLLVGLAYLTARLCSYKLRSLAGEHPADLKKNL